MDLDCGKPDSKIYYYSTGSQFIVTYWHVYDKGSDSDYITFQVILYSNGNINIQFNDTESIVPAPESINGNALVGIENQDGSEGLSYHNNGDGGPLFGSPLAIMFGKDPYLLPVERTSTKINLKYFLAQNFPNPFNPLTQINFGLKESGYVKLFVYNILGQKIRELVDNHLAAGNHEAVFNGNNLSSGVYFYRIEIRSDKARADVFSETKKFILLK